MNAEINSEIKEKQIIDAKRGIWGLNTRPNLHVEGPSGVSKAPVTNKPGNIPQKRS